MKTWSLAIMILGSITLVGGCSSKTEAPTPAKPLSAEGLAKLAAADKADGKEDKRSFGSAGCVEGMPLAVEGGASGEACRQEQVDLSSIKGVSEALGAVVEAAALTEAGTQRLGAKLMALVHWQVWHRGRGRRCGGFRFVGRAVSRGPQGRSRGRAVPDAEGRAGLPARLQCG